MSPLVSYQAFVCRGLSHICPKAVSQCENMLQNTFMGQNTFFLSDYFRWQKSWKCRLLQFLCISRSVAKPVSRAASLVTPLLGPTFHQITFIVGFSHVLIESNHAVHQQYSIGGGGGNVTREAAKSFPKYLQRTGIKYT